MLRIPAAADRPPDGHGDGAPDVPWPTAFAELDPAERFIVWSFRRWVLGWSQGNADHWSLVWAEFNRQFGDQEGKTATAAFAGLIDVLRWRARRPIHHHQPCCPCLAADEICILVLVAAAQHGQRDLARAVAGWLVTPEAVGALADAGANLAHCMSQHGLALPERASRGTSAPAPQPRAVLH